MLRLQQAAGNRAVGRVLARRAVRQTGLRSEQAIERFVHKAVSFLGRNGDGTLLQFALYLGAAVNTELETIGCPPARVNTKVPIDAAAQFDAGGWTIILNPGEFSHRPEATTMGDLTTDEAAIIAMTVFHEARHAEQRFRVARLQAGEGKEPGFEMDEDAAHAAAAAPLRGGGLEVREAKEWRENEIGSDAIYREAVTWWLSELRKAAHLSHDVDAHSAGDLRERLGRMLRSWGKPGAAADVIRKHLASARARGKATIVRDVTRITREYDRAVAAQAALPEGAGPDEFKELTAALIELNRAVYAAYGDQPVEHDAWDAGNATFDAYQKTAAGH